MKRLLLAAAMVAAFATQSHAAYTECAVQKETDMANRPEGSIEPRWSPLEKGSKVAIRDTYRDWAFVVSFADGRSEYGWVPRNALVNCKAREGTP